jgi:hypothetical protein
MAMPGVAIGPGRALDAYSIRARWAPVFLVVLPPLILCFSLVPGLPNWNKLWPLLGAAGVVILIDQLGRDAGRRLQPTLWDSWGGAPTTAALRHRDSANPALLTRQHERIAAIVGQALPAADEEQADPAGADHAYEAAIAVLIARTRGRRTEYPLIFAENCNYGFRRNMLGLRLWGRLLAAATGILALAAIATGLAGLENIPLALAGVVLAVSAAATVIWWRVVTPGWVQPVAWAYAERLLEAAETLAETK